MPSAGQYELVVADLVDLRIAIAIEPDEAELRLIFGTGDRNVDVGGNLLAVEAAVIEAHFALGHAIGSLGHDIDDAARGTCAVEHRSRPFQDLDLLQRINVLPGRVVVAEKVLQVVAIFRRVEAPDLREIAARREAERLFRDARRIGQRVV